MEHAIIALRDLTQHCKLNQDEVISLNGVGSLLAVVGDVNSSLRGPAAQVLGNLARIDANSCYRDYLFRMHCAAALVALLRDGEPDQQIAACYGLENLARTHHGDQYEIMRIGGVKLLLKAVASEDIRLKASAVCALQYQQYTADEVASSIPHFVALLSDDISVLHAVTKVFQRLAVKTKYRAEIARDGGVDRLVTLLDTGNEAAEFAALSALENLSCGGVPDVCDWIRQSSSVPSLLKLLESGTEDQRWMALKILRTMALNDNKDRVNSDAIAQAGGIPILLRTLSLTNDKLTAAAVSVLDKLSTAAILVAIVKEGVIPLLNTLIKHKMESPAVAERSTRKRPSPGAKSPVESSARANAAVIETFAAPYLVHWTPNGQSPSLILSSVQPTLVLPLVLSLARPALVLPIVLVIAIGVVLIHDIEH